MCILCLKRPAKFSDTPFEPADDQVFTPDWLEDSRGDNFQFDGANHDFSASGLVSISPTLDASTIANTIPGNTSTTATITIGTPLNDSIDFGGDVDWFKVSLTAGTTYQIELFSSGGTAIASGDTFLSLYDGSGNLITFDDQGGAGNGAMITFTADTTGNFYISAEAYDSSATGSYTLEVDTFSNPSDTVANGIFSNPTLTVDGAAAESSLDYHTDQDWYAVSLVAGETYTFSLDGRGTTDPLLDPFLFLYDTGGNYVAFNDDESGSSFDSELTYTATSTGTYYIAAAAYTGSDTTSTGDYTLLAESGSGSGGGGSGASVVPTDSLDWGSSLTGLTNNTITVYFGAAGESFNGSEVSEGWDQWEIDAFMSALATFEDYIDVTFQQVFNANDAVFRLITETMGGGTLGYFYPPGQGAISGVGAFNPDGYGWTQLGLQAGGFGWITIIHEIGHGLGLAHPHDNGGTSTIMQGVTSDQDTGDFDLNQGVFTTMTYIDGWQTSPYGQSTSANFGWQSTIMPLDIALLQTKYGANTTHNSGNTVYDMDGRNNPGTTWTAIWDTGGKDTISAISISSDVVIDLREPTLQYEAGGGGYVSYTDGIHGGYVIAQGANIENATGGFGDDILNGNDLDNTLKGRQGADELNGFAGSDRLEGFSGNDTINGGDDNDFIFGGANDDTLNGGDGLDRIYGDEGIDTVNGGDMRDVILGGSENDILNGDAGNDRILGQADNDTINGGSGSDRIEGGIGNDTLNGGADGDTLVGDEGDDIFVVDAGDSLASGFDRILDFEAGDVLRLGAHTFVGTAAFTNTGSAQVRYSELANNRVRVDIDHDGDGVRDDYVLMFNITAGTSFTSDGNDVSIVVAPPKIIDMAADDSSDPFLADLVDDFGMDGPVELHGFADEWNMV